MSQFTVIDDEEYKDTNGQARFTVFGVGGGGGNAVQHMVDQNLTGVKFVCANTDLQALNRMTAPHKIQIGEQRTRGLGAGAKPEVGRESAEESLEEIQQQLAGTDIVFVTAGMGGGTGTGAAPIVAEVAKKMNILTVGVVTTPFRFEGRRRIKAAEEGILNLEQHVDSLIIIPNERLLEVYGDISMKEAYKKADDVLLNAVRSIFDLVINAGEINLDFADLQTAMSTRGYAMMGTGFGRGENRAEQAADMAIRSPLLDNINIKDAKGVLLNVTGGDDLTLNEINRVADFVTQIVDEDEVQFFYGSAIEPNMTGEIRVTVIATGLTRNTDPKPSKTAQHQPSSPDAQVQVDDDTPAIARAQQEKIDEQSQDNGRPSPMRISDFFKRQ